MNSILPLKMSGAIGLIFKDKKCYLFSFSVYDISCVVMISGHGMVGLRCVFENRWGKILGQKIM